MKTLRLIITLDCNLSCEYCCNKISEVKSRFIEKRLEEIDFTQYSAVCISGGEPLLRRDLIYEILDLVPLDVPMYLYTNGLNLKQEDSWFNGINVGIHYKEQMKSIFNRVGFNKKFVFCVEDIHKEEYLPNIPDKYIKTWKMNDCFHNVDTEDWVLLKE